VKKVKLESRLSEEGKLSVALLAKKLSWFVLTSKEGVEGQMANEVVDNLKKSSHRMRC